MNRFKYAFRVLLFLIFLVTTNPPVAHAYLDPGSGSYLVQILVASGLSIGLMSKTFWSHIMNFISSKNKKSTEQYDKALKTAQDLKEITPDNPKTLVLVANAYNLLKQYNNAQTAAEAALKIDENLYQPYRIISEIKFAKGYLKYEKFLKLEEEAKNVYGAEADRLVEERDAVKKEANDLFIASQNYLDKAKERTESSSELRYIKARKATLKQLLEATEKGFF